MQVQNLWNQYQVLREIGHGGMATIYLVQDGSGKQFAAKVLRNDRVGHRELTERFTQECQIHPGFRHPNIVHCYKTFNEPQGLLMEYITGGSLRLRMNRIHETGQSFDAAEILEIARQVCDALSYLHQQGYCHCDIKPDNILVDEHGKHYFLTDFGIVHQIGQLPTNRIGTLKYMPPEQHQAQQALGVSTDIYAFAILIYELLTNGEVPFKHLEQGNLTGQQNVDWTHAHLYQQPIPPSAYRRLRRGVDDVILRALSKDPYARYQTAQEFFGALSNIFYRSNAQAQTQHAAWSFTNSKTPNANLICTRASNQDPSFYNRSIAMKEHMQFGRRQNNEVRLNSAEISRRHALVHWDEGRGSFVIYDLGSSIGTRVNGQYLKANQSRSLSKGDLITLGDYNFRIDL